MAGRKRARSQSQSRREEAEAAEPMLPRSPSRISCGRRAHNESVIVMDQIKLLKNYANISNNQLDIFLKQRIDSKQNTLHVLAHSLTPGQSCLHPLHHQLLAQPDQQKQPACPQDFSTLSQEELAPQFR